MKTFTTYAEKKAKQFLNLLQGYTKGIRITAILILLLMGVSNAWAYNQSAKDLYFDNSEAKWSSCYVYIGHGSYTSCYDMTRVSGTQYLWQLPANFNGGNSWNGATGWVVCKEKWWASSNETIDKYIWHGDNNVTKKSTSAWVDTKIYTTNGAANATSDGTTKKVYTVTSYDKSNYTVTINTVEGGALTVTDYDDQAVATGASKIHLTVLKFSATPADGYVLDGVQINNGSTTTTIAAADLATTTHTLTSAVTITPVWHATTSTVTVTATATNGTVTGGGVVEEGTSVTLTATPADGYKFVNWTVGGAEVSTANPYTFTAEEDVTVVANFEELPETTVYFVNTPGWTNVKAYAYSPANASWPGVDATLEAEKIGDFDVYSYTATEGKYANVIFNGNGGQTADLTWAEGVDKYYIHNYNGNTGWYTQAEAENILVVPVVEETVYFVNNRKWSKVQAYAWNATSNNSWPGVALAATGEKIAGFDVYSYTAPQGYINVIFNNKTGDDGVQSADFKWTDGKYYYMDAAANYAGGTLGEVTTAVAPYALATDVYLAGEMTNWDTNKKEFKKATSDATSASVTVALEKQDYEFKLVISGTWKGNNGTMQRGGNGVHEGGWSFDGDGNCTIVADIAGDYTFTWNLTTNKLTVAYPSLPKHQVTATVNPAESGTVTGTGEYEQGATATLTATPNDGFVFVNWTKGGEEVSTETTYTFTVTEAVELVANFEEAQEETHTVTVSYMCNTTSIKDVTTPPVGVETPVSIEAPVIEGYTFQSWTIGDGIKTDNANTDNPISITTKLTGPYTLTANYTENPCVYFVNTARWNTINIYAWVSSDDQNKNGNWPGKAMTKEPEKISGYDVYKYVMPSGKNYDKLVFNQGNDDGKTGDLEWEDGKYYVYSAGQWVDKNEVADLLPKPVIYFKNNPKWKEVYVYFHTGDYWSDADNGGSGANGLTEANGRVCKMEKVGETDIYKYDYEASGIVPGNVIAFTEAKQPDYGNFHQTQAVYRTDYNPNMELFIPQATYETKNETKYYNQGLWMKYNSTESGYTITGGFNDWDQESDNFTSETSGGYIFQKELLLSSGNTYEFKIKNIKNDWFRTSTAITSTENTDIEFIVEKEDDLDKSNVTIKALSDGYYIFSIDLSTGKMLVNVEYPLMVGDYQMVYVENEVLGVKPYAKFHPAQSIRGITEGEKLDTVSFFINKTNGKNPAILLQRCSEIDGATITWEDIAIQYINDISRANPAAALAPAKKSAELYIGNGCPAVTKDAVYNFVLEQTNTGSHKAQILAENTHLYEGNYYIRTDGAAGGWSKYNTNPDNIMTHSQTALTHGGYDYYFCEWMLKGNNVKYVVANDYSYCVSDTLAKDDIVIDENGNLPADANVRYTWNSSTNALKRAYINGSGTIADRYLVLIGNEHLKDASGNTFPVGTGDRTGLEANETAFADMGNWLYQVDIKASEETLVKLTANYNGKIQYFKGSDDETEQLIKGSEDYYTLRLIYDFKTNYLVSGLVGNQEITDPLELEEVMIVRSHHDEAQTLKISNGSVTANKAYGVMTFNKTTLNDNSKSQYERALYWVSFPFDVKLDEAFGFGNYGEHWIMEYYDGAERAEKGLWKEPTYSYWKFIEDPKGYILEAGKGYVLCLDLALLGNGAAFWDHENTEIALYFPSDGQNAIVIDNNPAETTTIVDAHTCTIERDNRDKEDSNWNIIGVPAYTNIAEINSQGLNFYYQYDASKNSYDVNDAPTFNSMHAYMVQFAGEINWREQVISLSAIAARKQSAGKDQYTLRLALQQEGADHDHTFIRLQEDNATAEFDMNYDLCKIINSGANIYSMIGNVEVAANVLPVEERVIPIGLDIHETGNYTFAMPDGTDGITATLIDYETGTETNLLLADYTTELREGTNNERFALRVRPNHVATEVENTIQTDGNDNAKKYIIDGALYLLRDGKLYDAQGRMVQQ